MRSAKSSVKRAMLLRRLSSRTSPKGTTCTKKSPDCSLPDCAPGLRVAYTVVRFRLDLTAGLRTAHRQTVGQAHSRGGCDGLKQVQGVIKKLASRKNVRLHSH